MKKLTQLLITGGLFLATPVIAEDCCQWNGCWDLGAELLYWRPCSCDYFYGEVNATEGTGGQPGSVGTDTSRTLKMSPDFGFRLFGIYNSESGCSFTTLSWTYLRVKDSGQIGPNPGAEVDVFPFNNVTSGEVSQKDEYTRVYLRSARYLCQSQCINFYVYGGIDFIDIDQKRDVDAISGGNLLTFHEKSEFYAFGFDVGIGGEYEIGCGFNLSAQVGGIAAIGRRKHRFNLTQVTTPQTARGVYPSRIDCVPGIDARLGINYTFSCGCSDLLVEVGYALEHYFKALSTANIQRQSLGNLDFSSCEDIGFAGPYLKFQYRF